MLSARPAVSKTGLVWLLTQQGIPLCSLLAPWLYIAGEWHHMRGQGLVRTRYSKPPLCQASDRPSCRRSSLLAAWRPRPTRKIKPKGYRPRRSRMVYRHIPPERHQDHTESTHCGAVHYVYLVELVTCGMNLLISIIGLIIIQPLDHQRLFMFPTSTSAQTRRAAQFACASAIKSPKQVSEQGESSEASGAAEG